MYGEYIIPPEEYDQQQETRQRWTVEKIERGRRGYTESVRHRDRECVRQERQRQVGRQTDREREKECGKERKRGERKRQKKYNRGREIVWKRNK